LSPRERHEQVVAGKYGIGLLGFWSIGHRMDIRSRVGGGDVWVLRMVEDQERAELVRDRMAFETAETFCATCSRSSPKRSRSARTACRAAKRRSRAWSRSSRTRSAI
jgi:hypothetical protein